MTDAPYGPDDGGAWMTKAELARARGITLGSADRLIRKQRWRRQPGNDGRVRVLVPEGWESREVPEGPTDHPTSDPTGDPRVSDIIPAALAALEDAVAALREQLDEANARAERVSSGQAMPTL